MISTSEPHIKEIYVTKYALTRGIMHFSVGGQMPHNGKVLFMEISNRNMVTVRIQSDVTFGLGRLHFHGEGKDWHRTLAEAQKRGDKMRKAKIANLFKEAARLGDLTFDTAAEGL